LYWPLGKSRCRSQKDFILPLVGNSPDDSPLPPARVFVRICRVAWTILRRLSQYSSNAGAGMVSLIRVATLSVASLEDTGLFRDSNRFISPSSRPLLRFLTYILSESPLTAFGFLSYKIGRLLSTPLALWKSKISFFFHMIGHRSFSSRSSPLPSVFAIAGP